MASLRLREDPERFREALTFTESELGFTARLIEKDYFCSVLLEDLVPMFALGLVFKGGTSLSKVHADFYRLSEDLDFVFHMEADASRSDRRKTIDPLKQHLEGLPARLPSFSIAEPLLGHNQSTQYIAALEYRSQVSGRNESIKVEIGLREPILEETETGAARTMLCDPVRGEAAIDPIDVQVLSLRETYAEKTRAALSRLEPAVRDFYDIDYAVRSQILNPHDPPLIELARRKLAVSGHDLIDVSRERLEALRRQLVPQLRPVLRVRDFDAFDLDRAFGIVLEMHSKLSAP